jgi:protein-disulfide isomerase
MRTRAAPAVPALALIAMLGAPPNAEPVAATVGEEPIRVAELDAREPRQVEALRARLREVFEAALDRVIDEQIGAPATAPRQPVSDADVAAFRAARREDFEGDRAPSGGARDRAVQSEAIRAYLERERREQAFASARAAARAEHAIEIALPSGRDLERPLPDERLVGRLDGAPLHAGAVERAAALKLYRLRGELHRTRLRLLERELESALLAREAERRGQSLAALESELSEPSEVSDAELAAFLRAERAAGRAVQPERARPYLEFRKRHARRQVLVARLRASEPVEILLAAPAPPRLPLGPLDAGPSLGAGPRTLVVHGNYRCRSCRALHVAIDELLAQQADVRVVFRDFLPTWDPVAEEAAQLARCAAEQGRFAEMRTRLLAIAPPDLGQHWYAEPGAADLARAAGAEPARLAACLVRPDWSERIERDTEFARSLGFETAPALVAEGAALSGLQSAATIGEALERARRAP